MNEIHVSLFNAFENIIKLIETNLANGNTIETKNGILYVHMINHQDETYIYDIIGKYKNYDDLMADVLKIIRDKKFTYSNILLIILSFNVYKTKLSMDVEYNIITSETYFSGILEIAMKYKWYEAIIDTISLLEFPITIQVNIDREKLYDYVIRDTIFGKSFRKAVIKSALNHYYKNTDICAVCRDNSTCIYCRYCCCRWYCSAKCYNIDYSSHYLGCKIILEAYYDEKNGDAKRENKIKGYDIRKDLYIDELWYYIDNLLCEIRYIPSIEKLEEIELTQYAEYDPIIYIDKLLKEGINIFCNSPELQISKLRDVYTNAYVALKQLMSDTRIKKGWEIYSEMNDRVFMLMICLFISSHTCEGKKSRLSSFLSDSPILKKIGRIPNYNKKNNNILGGKKMNKMLSDKLQYTFALSKQIVQKCYD